MKRYISLFAIFSLLMLAFACERDESLHSGKPKEEGFLEFRSVAMAVKSATMGGESIYNENAIRSIDIFFYPMGGTDTNAVLHRRFDISQQEGAGGVVNKRVYLDEGSLVEIAGGVRKCEAYTIANLPSSFAFSDENPANSSIPELKALALEGNFQNNLPSSFISKNMSFVMDARDTIQFTSLAVSLVATGTIHDNGPIELKRVASKVRVHVTQEPEITVHTYIISGSDTLTNEDKWIPIIEPLQDNIKIYLNNASDHGVVGGSRMQIQESSQLFNYAKRSTVDKGPATVNGILYDHSYQAEPFYTYPVKWSYGLKKEPFIKVEQVWGRVLKDSNGDYVTDNEGNYVVDLVKRFYYKVFFPMNELDRNTWYEVGVHLGLLGSETDETAIVLDSCYYYVVPWSNGYTGNSGIAELPGEVGSARFLQVIYSADADGFINVYNQDSIAVSYVTSHDCVIDNVTAYYDDYSQMTKQQISVDPTEAASWVSLSGNYIKFKHPLENDISNTDVNVGAFYVEFDVEHADNPAFNRHIKIVQYPSMYISYRQSNGYVFVNGYTFGPPDGTYNTWNYSVTAYSDYYVSGGQNVRDNLGSVCDPDYSVGHGTVNVNSNNYIIHVSVLEDSLMYIADTRGPEAPMSHFNAGKLDYYRATRTDAGFAVSPEFTVASSYGKTAPMTYENAKRRCAAYQENGYPQGRWRLPTAGEINFCVMLCVYNKIPPLFNGQYWAASGEFFSTSTTPSNNGMSDNPSTLNVGINPEPRPNAVWWTRCVYDTWAWGEESVPSALTTATWSQNL